MSRGNHSGNHDHLHWQYLCPPYSRGSPDSSERRKSWHSNRYDAWNYKDHRRDSSSMSEDFLWRDQSLPLTPRFRSRSPVPKLTDIFTNPDIEELEEDCETQGSRSHNYPSFGVCFHGRGDNAVNNFKTRFKSTPKKPTRAPKIICLESEIRAATMNAVAELGLSSAFRQREKELLETQVKAPSSVTKRQHQALQNSTGEATRKHGPPETVTTLKCAAASNGKRCTERLDAPSPFLLQTSAKQLANNETTNSKCLNEPKAPAPIRATETVDALASKPSGNRNESASSITTESSLLEVKGSKGLHCGVKDMNPAPVKRSRSELFGTTPKNLAVTELIDLTTSPEKTAKTSTESPMDLTSSAEKMFMAPIEGVQDLTASPNIIATTSTERTQELTGSPILMKTTSIEEAEDLTGSPEKVTPISLEGELHLNASDSAEETIKAPTEIFQDTTASPKMIFTTSAERSQELSGCPIMMPTTITTSIEETQDLPGSSEKVTPTSIEGELGLNASGSAEEIIKAHTEIFKDPTASPEMNDMMPPTSTEGGHDLTLSPEKVNSTSIEGELGLNASSSAEKVIKAPADLPDSPKLMGTTAKGTLDLTTSPEKAPTSSEGVRDLTPGTKYMAMISREEIIELTDSPEKTLHVHDNCDEKTCGIVMPHPLVPISFTSAHEQETTSTESNTIVGLVEKPSTTAIPDSLSIEHASVEPAAVSASASNEKSQRTHSNTAADEPVDESILSADRALSQKAHESSITSGYYPGSPRGQSFHENDIPPCDVSVVNNKQKQQHTLAAHVPAMSQRGTDELLEDAGDVIFLSEVILTRDKISSQNTSKDDTPVPPISTSNFMSIESAEPTDPLAIDTDSNSIEEALPFARDNLQEELGTSSHVINACGSVTTVIKNDGNIVMKINRKFLSPPPGSASPKLHKKKRTIEKLNLSLTAAKMRASRWKKSALMREKMWIKRVKLMRKRFARRAKQSQVMPTGSCEFIDANVLEHIVDNELSCIICCEPFLKATTLNCSHTFCHFCWCQWKIKEKTCPICRCKVTREFKTPVIDAYVEKVGVLLGEPFKERRSKQSQIRAASEKNNRKASRI